MNTRNIRFRSNRVRDIIGLFHEELDAMYGISEVSVFCEMLFEAFLGWNKVRLLTSKEQTVNQSDLLRFHWALEDLKRYRPIQHIIGYTDFCGCRIAVSPDVLIPRPETEEIVNWTLSTLHSPLFALHSPLSTLRFLDLCTGSGCIAIALKKAFSQAEVTAVDVSDKALEIARRNAESNGTEINFIQADLLATDCHLSSADYHLIISNPPYVMEKERVQMQPNVLGYEPDTALFVPDVDPLLFYRAIASVACSSLTLDGLLVVEVNETLADATAALLGGYGLVPTVHADFRDKPRFVTATRINNL